MRPESPPSLRKKDSVRASHRAGSLRIDVLDRNLYEAEPRVFQGAGGPYVLFPIAARLIEQGAAPGAVIALVTAKTLISPIRAITFEAPLLGWPLTMTRLLPSLLVPPLLGLIVQRLSSLVTSSQKF